MFPYGAAQMYAPTLSFSDLDTRQVLTFYATVQAEPVTVGEWMDSAKIFLPSISRNPKNLLKQGLCLMEANSFFFSTDMERILPF